MEEAAFEGIIVLLTALLFWFCRLRAPVSVTPQPKRLPCGGPRRDHDNSTGRELATLLEARQWESALSLYERTRHQLSCFAPDAAIFDRLVLCAARCSRPQSLHEVLQDMKRLELPRSQALYESAMRVMASGRDFGGAAELYHAMVHDGVAPSNEAQSCMVCFLAQRGDISGAIEMFSGDFRPSIRAYMQVFRGLARLEGRNCALQTLRMLSDMHQRGIPLDVICLNVALGTIVNAGEVEAGEELLRSHASLADTISYNILIKGLVKEGRASAAWELVQEMECLGLQLSRPTFLGFASPKNQFTRQAMTRLRLLEGRCR